jgi:hypothetical protein
MQLLGDVPDEWDRRNLNSMDVCKLKKLRPAKSVCTAQLGASEGDIDSDVIEGTTGELA